MISKQRGIIDPWTLGFLIGLTGFAITQPWNKVSNERETASASKVEISIAKNNSSRINEAGSR